MNLSLLPKAPFIAATECNPGRNHAILPHEWVSWTHDMEEVTFESITVEGEVRGHMMTVSHKDESQLLMQLSGYYFDDKDEYREVIVYGPELIWCLFQLMHYCHSARVLTIQDIPCFVDPPRVFKSETKANLAMVIANPVNILRFPVCMIISCDVGWRYWTGRFFDPLLERALFGKLRDMPYAKKGEWRR